MSPSKTKKPTDDDRQEKIKTACKPMLAWLGFLQRYRLIVSFTDELGKTHRSGAVATVEEEYPYRIVHVQCKRDWIDRADPEGLEEILLHEVLHVELFGALERYLTTRGVTRGDREFADLQESAVDLVNLWLFRMRMDLGKAAWEV